MTFPSSFIRRYQPLPYSIMIKRPSMCARPPGKHKITKFILSVAIATMLTEPGHVRAHEGDIIFPEVFPVGTTGLLPDLETNPTKDGVVGPLLPMHTMS